MRSTLQTSFALAVSLFYSGLSVHAGTTAAPASCKDMTCEIDEVNFVETAKPGIVVSGYIDAGYSYNFVSMSDLLPTRAFTTDANPQGDFNLYAAKVVMEKPLSDENKLQAGFRADIIMGEDAGDLGTNGGPNNSDSFYLQQAYAQFRLPWGNGLDVIAGKWQAIIGYEAEERPANPNITPGIVSAIDPAWYTGVLLSYPIIKDTLKASFGVGNGSGLDNGMDLELADHDQVVLTGALGLTAPGGNADTSVGFHWGPGGDAGYGSDNESLIILNWLGNWTPKFANDKLLLAFNTSLASFNDYGTLAPFSTNDASTFFGVAVYAKYQLTDIVSLAARGEYAHTDDSQLYNPYSGVFVPFNAATNDVWTWTGTVGFDLTENLMLRAEYRIDFGDDVRINGTTGASQHTAQMIATEVVFSF